ncbi:hypothetical protein EDB84DRAFT_1653012 [Lactarius hengduanensis]|nr:hypothetical protein EDB84DRAFT_1653012 [Lactarius hengduanensis]
MYQTSWTLVVGKVLCLPHLCKRTHICKFRKIVVDQYFFDTLSSQIKNTIFSSMCKCEIIQYNEDQSKITVVKNRQRRWGGPESVPTAPDLSDPNVFTGPYLTVMLPSITAVTLQILGSMEKGDRVGDKEFSKDHGEVTKRDPIRQTPFQDSKMTDTCCHICRNAAHSSACQNPAATVTMRDQNLQRWAPSLHVERVEKQMNKNQNQLRHVVEATKKDYCFFAEVCKYKIWSDFLSFGLADPEIPLPRASRVSAKLQGLCERGDLLGTLGFILSTKIETRYDIGPETQKYEVQKELRTNCILPTRRSAFPSTSN